MHVGVCVCYLRSHRLDDFDDADADLPCAGGRSKARKACRKKSRSICWRPTSPSSSAMRALASAERLSSYVASGFSLRGPGLGPRLRFNPSGLSALHALIQSWRILREIRSHKFHCAIGCHLPSDRIFVLRFIRPVFGP